MKNNTNTLFQYLKKQDRSKKSRSRFVRFMRDVRNKEWEDWLHKPEVESVLNGVMNLDLKVLSQISDERVRQLIVDLQQITYFSSSEVTKRFEGARGFAIGGTAFLLYHNGTALKFSQNNDHEYIYLRKVNHFHDRQQRNVIKMLGYYAPDTSSQRYIHALVKPALQLIRDPPSGILRLEYVDGDTIENMLKSGRTFTQQEILHFSYDIAHGLYELRQCGIAHRDIHDRNIMIDTENNRAVIIDLGAATFVPVKYHRGNRAFGGNNDLLSLGQLMYKMATGANLFNEAYGFTCYSAVKNSVRTRREEVYDNPKLLRQKFRQVRKDVPKTLCTLIVGLLDDELWEQPGKVTIKKFLENVERHKHG